MKRRSPFVSCLLVGVVILILLLLAAGGVWWFYIGQYTTAAVTPGSPVQVFLLSPSSGDDVAAGDFVLVDLQAVAPQAISWSEVFVDGTSLGALTDSPERTSWSWRAWPPGVHVLAGRAQAADGQLGESQTVILNVVAVDETMQVQAAAGQTLADVGAQFAAPPDQLAGANPNLDPSKPLAEGQPVNVPTGGSKPQPPGGSGAPGAGGVPGGESAPFVIQWELKLTGQVDKSYCYLSDGSGDWDKMPKQPFVFFGDLNNLYTQVFEATPGAVSIQAQCWGWLGGALKYLGQGVTKPIENGPLQVTGEGFVLTGIPKPPEGKESQLLGGGQLTVPPPFSMRESKDSADCTAHSIPFVGGFICNTLMNDIPKEYIILEWEWQPGLPGTGNWVNDIDGYRLYEIIPDTEAPPKLLKSVTPWGARAAALPIPWAGAHCYGVRAFVDDAKYGGLMVSEMATFCLGQPPQMKIVKLSELAGWLTAVDMLEVGDDCLGFDDFHGVYKEGMGEIFTGSYDVDVPAEDCYQNVYYTGAVKFKIPAAPLPAGAVLQKTLLRYSHIFKDGYKPISYANLNTCVYAVGKAKKDWTGLSDADHWIHFFGLGSYAIPMISAPAFAYTGVNVTAVVSDWIKNPANNHGFIIFGNNPSSENDSYCVSGLGNFQLELQYLAP